MAASRIIQSDVDLTEVFASPHLQGLYYFKPIPQTQDHTCGAAAVSAVIRYLGGEANEGQCAQSMGTNRVVGTEPHRMVNYLRRRGYRATANTEVPFQVLVDRVRQGKITLVDYNDYGGHWVVVAGVEPFMQAIVLADPARPRSNFAAHSYASFRKHWICDDFGGGGKLQQLAVFVDVWATGDGVQRKSDDRVRARDRYKPMRPGTVLPYAYVHRNSPARR